MNPKIQKFFDGEVTFWIEQGQSIHLKAVAAHGDPVELTPAEAQQLAYALLQAVREIETSDSN